MNAFTEFIYDVYLSSFRDPLYASNAFILYIQAESWISEQSGFAHVGKTQQRRRCFFHVQVLHAAALNIGESENATVPLGCDGWRVVVFCANIPNLEMISWHFWCLTIESKCVVFGTLGEPYYRLFFLIHHGRCVLSKNTPGTSQYLFALNCSWTYRPYIDR